MNRAKRLATRRLGAGQLTLLLIVMLLLPLFRLQAQKADTLKVLMLNSYHQGYIWTDGIVESIRSEFAGDPREIQLLIEYMDTKHYHSKEYTEMLRNLYLFKYKRVHLDLIIVTDNYALDFVKKYRKQLFNHAPVIFCGIDGFDRSLIKGFPDITGVVEDYDLQATLEMALRLFPSTRNIAVLSDDSVMGRQDMDRFNRIAPFFKDYKIIPLVGWTIETLKQKLAGLPEHTIVLRLSYQHAWDGTMLTEEERGRIWSENCHCPTFTSMGHKVEHGALGGIINSPELHGKAVAEIAKRIFNGEKARDIPIIMKSPSVPMFDYYQLKRFNVRTLQLPPMSVIINKPFSFYQQYKLLVWSVVSIFSVLFALLLLLSVNIVNRRQAQKALKASEEKYRVLIETIPHGILEIDLSGQILFVNKALQKMLKYNKEDLLGMLIYDFLPPEQHERIKRGMESVIKSRQGPSSSSGRYETRDGAKIDVQLDWNYKKNVDGKVNGIIFVVSNITEKVEAEREARIRQEQLIQADKMVALGTLVSGVAHEINNPNNFILLNVPMLQRTWRDVVPILDEYYANNGDFKVSGIPYSQMRREFQEICSDILEGSKRINVIVQDLKKYSRNNEAERCEPVDVNQVIGSCVRLLGNNIAKYTDNLVLDLDENIPEVKGNFQHLEQVLINLIQNACQAIDDKKKEVRIASYYDADDNTVIISVEDHGEGIPAENLSRIFDPFFTTKRDKGGTGLGLSVSNNIIQKYGGRFKFTSEPDEGTKVEVIVPVDFDKREEMG